MKIVAISDTHNRHKKLEIPECDLLIHAGDFTSFGYKHEIEDFAKWINKQSAKNVVIVPGNHELYFENGLPLSKEWIKDNCPNAHLLIEESVEIEGIKIYGSPITPWFHDWAWNRHPQQITKHWNNIPEDTKILITHSPPYGILDETTYANGDPKPGFLGCPQLLKRVQEIKPDLHFFGHIHAGYGEKHIDGTSYYNCSNCDETYCPSNSPTVVEYEP